MRHSKRLPIRVFQNASLLSILFLLFSLTTPVVSAAGVDSKNTIPETAQGQEGGFWRTDHNFDSVLRLKNVLLHQALEVTPALYFADGTIYRLSPVHLEAAGIAQINIRAELQLLPPALSSHLSEFGMAAIEYKWPWPAVLATVQNIDEVASLTGVSAANADIAKVHSATEPSALQVIRGAWWFQDKTSESFLVLQNTAPFDKQVNVQIADKTGALIVEKSIQLSSHATSRLKLSTLIEKPVEAGMHGSVTIRYQGVAHSILATGILEDETTGFSATPHLIEQYMDPDQPIHSVSLHAPGLMLGDTDPAMLFPSGTVFIPYSILQNVSARSLAVSIALTTENSDGTPKSVTLDTLTLAPGEVRKGDFSRYFPKGTPASHGFGNLTFTYQGRDGELQVDAGSIDGSQSYVFEATPSLGRATASRTFCFWSIEGDTDTMISVWNYLDTPQDLVLTLFYSGGHYKIPLHLDAQKTHNLDLMALVKSRVPDPDGNLIPSNITSGSGLISSLGGEIAEISVAISAATYNVRTATCVNQCQTCNGVQSLKITPNPAGVAVGGTVQLFAQETLNTGSISTVTSGTWSVSSGASVNSNGLLTGVNPGVVTINLTESSLPSPAGNVCTGPNGGCPPAISLSTSATGGVAGACPTSIAIDTTFAGNLANDSPPFYTGVGILARMIVGPVGTNFNGANLYETVTPTGNNCPAAVKAATDFPTITLSQNSLLIVGNAAGWENIHYDPMLNVFYDSHTMKSFSSVLTGTGATTCQSTATQTYYCKGNPVSTFSLTNNLYTGFLNAQPVTLVTVSKQ
jgi:WD40 repeat protein